MVVSRPGVKQSILTGMKRMRPVRFRHSLLASLAKLRHLMPCNALLLQVDSLICAHGERHEARVSTPSWQTLAIDLLDATEHRGVEVKAFHWDGWSEDLKDSVPGHWGSRTLSPSIRTVVGRFHGRHGARVLQAQCCPRCGRLARRARQCSGPLFLPPPPPLLPGKLDSTSDCQRERTFIANSSPVGVHNRSVQSLSPSKLSASFQRLPWLSLSVTWTWVRLYDDKHVASLTCIGLPRDRF